MPNVKEYLIKADRAVNDCVPNMNYFIERWTKV